MNKLNQLTAEIVYWATGRTKIYPEKDFTGNYRRITFSFEKKEKGRSDFDVKRKRL